MPTRPSLQVMKKTDDSSVVPSFTEFLLALGIVLLGNREESISLSTQTILQVMEKNGRFTGFT